VQLFADRFVLAAGANGEHAAIDLATGTAVTILTSSAGGSSDQIRWSIRCDRFFQLRHRCIARLVDYGLVGEGLRFEAWQCGERWRGSRRAAAGALAHATIFLHAIAGRGDSSADGMRVDRGRPVLLPDAAIGYDDGVGASAAEDLASCGINTIHRRSIVAAAEVLGSPNGAAPQPLLIAAAEGAGLSVAIHHLARAARLNGFVPLALSAGCVHGLVEAIEGRTLCLIDRRGGWPAWQALLGRLLATPKPHVLLSIGSHALPGAPRLRLGRVTPDAMIRAVIPTVESARLRKAVERAARRADGLPGRFSELLWGPAGVRGLQPGWGRTAAERPPAYGAPVSEPIPVQSPSRRAWPAASDVAPLRARLAEMLALVAAGRHAAGERGLRAIVGSLARRHDWHQATRGQLGLAAALLRRGRAREAHLAFADARTYAVRGGDDALLLETSIGAGRALFDAGRLDEAETVLRGSVAAARSAGTGTFAAAGALARCLFWRGHYDEADAVLDAAGAAPGGPEDVTLQALRSRIALGRGDLSAAISHAACARDRAERDGRQAPIAQALYAVAFAHLAAGDLRGVAGDVRLCVQAARGAHDPLRALKGRLIAAEAARRTGSRHAAERLVRLTARAGRIDLPATVRGRLALLSDLSRGVDDAVRRQAAATGLRGLALFAPSGTGERTSAVYDAAIDILKMCQAGDDDLAVLAEVCRSVRARLRAAGTAIFVRDGQTVLQVAGDGHGIEPAIATRAIEARQALPPCRYDERIESAVPIRYAGETLGALTARWTIAAPGDAAPAEMVLTMAATAAATAVSAAIARRRTAAAGPHEILGISSATADLRRAVERAASAPFTVLVEGESGSGKELVARALHRRSPRRDRCFSAVNCAALPDDLVDAELFGHSRGAFTGALTERAGVFEESHLGTLFFDEVGELSPRAQAKVLRTLQEGEVRRVGENIPRRVDVRLVAATNRDLRQEVAAGRFRLDLMYRLDVIRITVAPLRDRRDDIPLLVEHFWRSFAERIGSRAMLSAHTVGALARYDWPGNVRELQNVLAALAVRAPRRGVVPPSALPPAFGMPPAAGSLRLGDARRTFEERFIRAALARTGGHRARAAEELGLSRQGLAKLMSRLQIGG
jgi:DNA-binding NtrC family response regulator